MFNQKEFQQRARRVEELVRKVESAFDPGVQATARELLQALMDLHGAGLERIMELVHQSGEPGVALMAAFQRDEFVKGLLLLHGLHPLDIGARVRQALEKTNPYLRSLGGGAELLGVDDAGAVRLRLTVSSHGCGSGAAVKAAVEEAIYDAAPDLTALVIEGVPDVQHNVGFVPLEQLRGNNHPAVGLPAVVAPAMKIQRSEI